MRAFAPSMVLYGVPFPIRTILPERAMPPAYGSVVKVGIGIGDVVMSDTERLLPSGINWQWT